jgi:hypothetical protein
VMDAKAEAKSAGSGNTKELNYRTNNLPCR